MKVGTAPKITVGAAALIALIFIGFVGIRQMNVPTVEERVYLSPWEDGTARPRNNPEGLPTDITQDAASGGIQPQSVTTESATGLEPIDNFFDQPDETDMAQFPTETEFERDAEQDFTTDISASSESTNQSAKDVMYAYLEAYRNFDNDALYSLMTEEHRHSHRDNYASDEPPLELVDKIVELMRERNSQAEVVSSKYVGDEFHFRLTAPALDIPIVLDGGATAFIGASYELIKIRKEDGVWLIYDRVYDHDRTKSEMPEVPHYH